MKTFATNFSSGLFFVALFVVARGANTLTGTVINLDNHGAFTPECLIEQCLNPDKFFTDCAAAASQDCRFKHEFVISGALTDSDICALPLPSATETPLWLKLDLNVANINKLADSTCTYVSGTLAFQTANPRSGDTLMLDLSGSLSLACDASLDPAVPAVPEVAQWVTDTTRVEFRPQAFPTKWLAAHFDGKHAMVLNAESGFTETDVGSITGFTAEDWRVSCVSSIGGTLAPVSPLQEGVVSLTNVAGSCVDGCADKGSVAGVEACLAEAAPGCDFSATYTVTDASIYARSTCELEDNTRVVGQRVLPDLGHNTGITGSLFLDTGSLPVEECQVDVALLTSLDLGAADCGYPNNVQIAETLTFTLSPDVRSMQLGQLPDNFAGVALTPNKEWRFCGGAVNAFRVEGTLSSALDYRKLAPGETTEAAVPTQSPSEAPGSSGVMATLTLAAASLASLAFFL